MSKLVRFGVSLEKGLLDKFDVLIARRGFASRSEAFRDLIRTSLIEKEWTGGEEVAGAITLAYDHHLIISTQHIHLDHDHCLEIIAVRGPAVDVGKLADSLRSVKGVKHGTVSMSSVGKDLD
jgi:CopG family nickel-responsive transcriptional regulator